MIPVEVPAPFACELPWEMLLSGLPVTERHLRLAGISAAVLKGGDGPPIVLLHGPSEHAAKWLRIIPELMKAPRVIAVNWPGHSASGPIDGAVDADRVLACFKASPGNLPHLEKTFDPHPDVPRGTFRDHSIPHVKSSPASRQN